MKNLFITFEGIEGCGKTTQAKLLVDKLRQCHAPVLFTREPGGTRIGDQIRKIVLSPENTDIVPLAELLLYEASRAQHVQELILPNLRNGVTVICDRYGDASIAYQGAGRNLPPELVKEANRLATGGLQPDLTLLLDVAPEIGLARARARNMAFEVAAAESRFEEEDLRFHRAVRDGYLTLLRGNPARFRLIDGSGSVEDAQRRIQETVLPLLSVQP